MFGLVGFWNVLVSFIVGLALFLCIFWLMLPYIFRWFVCPHFDGSYSPKKDTISMPEILPPQASGFTLKKDGINQSYSLSFGDGREFSNGNVQVHYNGIYYAAHPIEDEQQLEFVEELVEDFESTAYNLEAGQKITWVWKIPNTDYSFNTSFLIFAGRGIIGFEVTSTEGVPNIANGNYDQSIFNFPMFRNDSYNLRYFTYKNLVFSPGTRDFTLSFAPVCMFDDDKNAVIFSALDNFVTNGIEKSVVDGKDILKGAIEGEVTDLPAGHSHHHLMVLGTGINATFKKWGDLLLQYYGNSRADKDRYRDIDNAYLGYHTDNGAHYYYNPIKDTGYDGTLLAVKEYAEKEEIPFAYYHLDSWWYKKSVKEGMIKLLGGFGRILGGGLYGGCILWEEEPSVFNRKDSKDATILQQLSKEFGGIPFTAHNRWYSDKSPYIEKYNFIIEGNGSMPKNDPKFWDEIMQNAVDRNIITYEQDWLKTHLSRFSFLRSEMGAAHIWLKNMAEAAEKKDLAIQYCMAPPSMIMQSAEFKPVISARCSGDYGPRWPKRYDMPYFMQSSMLAYSVGIWPFKDTFQSTSRGPINGERKPLLMGLVSNLSAGMVAPGDEIGMVNKNMVNAVCRKDGLLYKPDRPITACDLTYTKNRKYYICSTESTHGPEVWYYVLTMNLWPSRVKDRKYRLEDIDIQGSFVEYDWFTKEVRKMDSHAEIVQKLKEEDYRYRIYAPILPNGFAVLGDPTKWVMASNKEFSKIIATKTGIEIEITNIKGETSEILIFTEQAPQEILLDSKKIDTNSLGKIRSSYEPKQKLLHIIIPFDIEGTKILKLK